IELNHLKSARVLEVALSNFVGTIQFTAPKRETGTLASSTTSAGPLLDLPCSRLDNVLSMNFLSNCSLAKMDVEGCETLVLQGAVDILSTCQIPVWLFELSDAALKHQG